MNRLREVETLAALLSEPARGTVRGVVDSIRDGRFEGGLVATLVRRRPELRWIGLLLALEVSELRLAGSVTFHTPRRSWMDTGPDGFHERWGEWAIQVFPCEAMAKLGLRHTATGWVLFVEGDRDYGGPHPALEAVSIFKDALESFGGAPVSVVPVAA